MSNISAKITKEKGVEFLTVTIPINKRQSKTGKTTVIASTNGNILVGVEYDGKPVTLGVNAYYK